MQVNKVAEDRTLVGIVRGRKCSFGAVSAEILACVDGHVDDGAGRVAALADEGFGAGWHVGEIVGDEEKFDCSFVGVLEDNLHLALLGNAIATARRGFG